MDLGSWIAIWAVSVIGATLAGRRVGRSLPCFALGLLLGPAGALIAIAISGGLNLLPENYDSDD